MNRLRLSGAGQRGEGLRPGRESTLSAKDIIISSGENVSMIGVERSLVRRPVVLEAAVIAIPDEKWGERPKAFVTLRVGAMMAESELIAFSRETLPGFKAPSEVEFGGLPKTSIGEITRYELRERVRSRFTVSELMRSRSELMRSRRRASPEAIEG
jgi:acyl-CoA synthetase (AMP-forming)/AMP-acid ligase II